MNVRHHLLVAGVVLPLLLSLCPLQAQTRECPPPQTLLSTTDAVYTDAMELKQILERQGFVVWCMFPTKLESIFRVEEDGVMRSTIEGEVNFRTNYGDVDAVFLPKPQTFSKFKITEHHQDGGFLYTFAGTPRVHVSRFESARQINFLKSDNKLFLIDDALRPRLELALQSQHQNP